MPPYTMTDAEAELRAAVDRDAPASELDAIARRVEALDVRPGVSMHAAALWYAEQGIHVFPLSPGTKIPLKGSGGCLDATDDLEQVNAWWGGNPYCNIGIATGHVVDVVDIDGFTGQKSRLEHWDDIFAAVDADALGKVSTPRPGGMHIYVPATGDGNSTNIVPSVDYRGAGGYVVAPPSVNEVGKYLWLGELHLPPAASKAA